MRAYDADSKDEDDRGRNWMLEVLVVVGILAFGYFAVTLPSAPPAFEDRGLDEVAGLSEP